MQEKLIIKDGNTFQRKTTLSEAYNFPKLYHWADISYTKCLPQNEIVWLFPRMVLGIKKKSFLHVSCHITYIIIIVL